MSIMPIITFKAGMCDLDTSTEPARVKPRPTPGYIYLYNEDDLIHFCWRVRSAPMHSPELDLVMVPTDCHFAPYQPPNPGASSDQPRPLTNGRIYVLKFSSSSQRHLFWLQSKSQSPQSDPSFFSPRDLKLGSLVDQLLQGEDVDVTNAIAGITSNRDADDGDETMEDVDDAGDGPDHAEGGSGGAGADATGGDVRQEGEEAREGGADGGRAASDEANASLLVQNLLNSLQGTPGAGADRQRAEKPFTTLRDLLTPSTTIPVIESVDESALDHLLAFLPPTLFLPNQDADSPSGDPSPDAIQAAIQTLSRDQKKSVLDSVLRSPQLSQSLGSLTMALHDGGLPTISEALCIRVRDGGFMRGGSMPLGGGEAVEAFVEGVKTSVQKEDEKNGDGANSMDTDP